MQDRRRATGVLAYASRGIARRLLAAVLAIAICGCATNVSRDSAVTPGGNPAAVVRAGDAHSAQIGAGADRGVSGVWQGTSLSDCVGEPSDPGRCSAMQQITRTMFQRGDEVTGYYACAFGNQVCRHLNETGVIRRGSVNRTRLTMRVMHEDGSMCFFTGWRKDDRFDGGYECLQGGGIIEQGTFRTRRTY